MVKIFYSKNSEEMSNQINKYLKDIGFSKLIDIKFTTDGEYYNALVITKP